jgi:DNA modification methylase
MINLMLGDCLNEMKKLDDNSVDSIVTDPPYGLSFMGKAWDKSVPSKEVWEEALRVLKPGGHLLAFAGTRTQHRMAVNIEDAGFEIRDMIAWVYGSGFPKSMNVSKAIDKVGAIDVEKFKSELRDAVNNSKMTRSEINSACGFSMSFDIPYKKDPKGWGVSIPSPEKWNKICETLSIHTNKWDSLIERKWRGRAGNLVNENTSMSGGNYERTTIEEAKTPAAKQWEGWGTALKPALEPITVARKPLESTVAANVLKHGTGGINIDASRVPLNGDYKSKANGRPSLTGLDDNYDSATADQPDTVGRFPANFIHDGSDEVTSLFPHSKSKKMTGAQQVNGGGKGANLYGSSARGGTTDFQASEGSAARFFYSAKVSRKERGENNNHPTVKPQELMKYLIRMVTPDGGIVLDPFMGSGSTGMAAKDLGFDFIGIELDPDYIEIAKNRIDSTGKSPTTFGDHFDT